MAAKHRSLARVAGLSVETLSKLEGHNFRTAEDVLTRSSLDLVELLDISLPAADRVFTAVAKNVCPKPTTAKTLLMSRTDGQGVMSAGPINPNSTPNRANSEAGTSSSNTHQSHGPAYVRGGQYLNALDHSLGGGVSTGSITELVGPAGAGKTQFCLTLAVVTAAPLSVGGLNSGVVYVDTEQKFSGQRVGQIAASIFPQVYCIADTDDPEQVTVKKEAVKTLTQRILILTPSTLSETYQRLQGLEEALIDHSVRLLIIDSVAALARAEFGVGRGQLQRRQELLGQIASVLKQQAERLHFAAFVTNQVTTRIGSNNNNEFANEDREFNNDSSASTTAALGVKWAHCVNTRLVLEGAMESGMEERNGGSMDVDTRHVDTATYSGVNNSNKSPSMHRVVKVVKSPRCALVGYEYQVWEGGVRVLGDRKVKVHPAGAAADGAIRGIFQQGSIG